MYCTLTDIKKMLPEELIIQLTDDEDSGSVNTERVDEAIDSADAEIDSYCGKHYSVPFSTVPDVIKKLSVDIAIYNLYSRLATTDLPEVRKDRYKNAVQTLKDIAKGIVSLGVDPAPAAHSEEGAATNKETDGNVFTRDKLKGF